MTIIKNRELSTLKRKKKSNIFHIKVLLIEQRNIKRKFMKKKFQWSFWLQCCCLFLVVNFVYYCKIYSIYFEYKYVISILPGGQPIKKSYIFQLKNNGRQFNFTLSWTYCSCFPGHLTPFFIFTPLFGIKSHPISCDFIAFFWVYLRLPLWCM